VILRSDLLCHSGERAAVSYLVCWKDRLTVVLVSLTKGHVGSVLHTCLCGDLVLLLWLGHCCTEVQKPLCSGARRCCSALFSESPLSFVSLTALLCLCLSAAQVREPSLLRRKMIWMSGLRHRLCSRRSRVNIVDNATGQARMGELVGVLGPSGNQHNVQRALLVYKNA